MTSALIDFSLNVNPFGSPPASIRAAHRALSSSNVYPDKDYAELRAAIADWHGVSPDSVLVGSGADEALKLLVTAWSTPGASGVIHIPTFPRYSIELECAGVHVHAVESSDPLRIDPRAIAARVVETRARIAILCVPNNPTGARIARADLEALVAELPNTWFVVDEAMIDPRDPGALHLVDRYPNVAVLRTFSKYFGLAGLRVGYAIAQPQSLAIPEAARPPYNVSSVAVAAALEALRDTAFVEACGQSFHREVEHFRQAIDRHEGMRLLGSVCNLVLLDVGIRSAAHVMNELKRRGLLVRSGMDFAGLNEYECIRISLLDRASNDRLITALLDVAATRREEGAHH